MTYDNFDELNKNYPERDDMSYEEETRYVEDCFDTYEHLGFSSTFQTPYEEYSRYNGMKFTVTGRVSCDNGEVDLECLPMWHITLENGKTISAFPEEICITEKDTNPMLASA